MSKKYIITDKAEFTLNKDEFNLMYNNLASFINGLMTPKSILKIVDAFSVLQSKFEQGVKDEVIVEQEQKEKEQ